MHSVPFIRRLPSQAVLIVALAAFTACGDRDTDRAATPPGDAPGTAAPQAADPKRDAAAAPVTVAGPHGKYGCIQTVPRMINGSWEYEIEQRGFITLANGRYTDPYQVTGTYRHDSATDSTFFTGGILDGANATPMEDRRLWVVIPLTGGRENRWTCGPA